MYTYVREVVNPNRSDKAVFLCIEHLNLKRESYYEKIDGRILGHARILQGFGTNGVPFERRERVILPSK